MSDTNQQPTPSLSIRDDFMGLLQSRWTRQVACQKECHPPESCSCQRNIVHVYALQAWWTRQVFESGPSRLERFLRESPLPPHLSLPIKPSRIVRGQQSCLRILSLLLKQGRDHLIDRFYEANMCDDYLMRSESDQNLREQLAGIVPHEEIEDIVRDFHREKWKYCPLHLTFDMDANLHGTKVILPFCMKIKLSGQGGTASIYWVAVQKDLIMDNALVLALQDSLYVDEEFGQCFQMVLKSYCGNRKRDFELEKEAFSGLQSNAEVPILQYLGSYTHDYGEGDGLGKTYNLLLEYGENDLYQAWADETNVPPVQAQEILQTYKSLFKVAEAIRHVHHLEILRGKGRPMRFHGWHADIKPDNILSVRGRLKLADFGYSSFAPVIDVHEGSVPIERIRGFTDTYGAPEVSRMKQPDGTMLGVSQAIDAWSFGCVLSVAATWIVLGFQGLRQYERVRQLSQTNHQDGISSDRFHDGYHVLPEVAKWHDYLRGHLRPSDTTTELVLALIEDKLLRTDPSERHNLEELCMQLQKLSDWAQHKIQSLGKYSRDTDPLITRALASIEEEALFQSQSYQRLIHLQPNPSQINTRERAYMQINKEEIIRAKPLGQTAHRLQVLRKNLGDYDAVLLNDEPLVENLLYSVEQKDSTEISFPEPIVQLDRSIKTQSLQIEIGVHSLNEESYQSSNDQFSASDPLLERAKAAASAVKTAEPETQSVTKTIPTRTRPTGVDLSPAGFRAIPSALTSRRAKSTGNQHNSNTARRRVSFQLHDQQLGASTLLEKTSQIKALESENSVRGSSANNSVGSLQRHRSTPTISAFRARPRETLVIGHNLAPTPECRHDKNIALHPKAESSEDTVSSTLVSQSASIAQTHSRVQIQQVSGFILSQEVTKPGNTPLERRCDDDEEDETLVDDSEHKIPTRNIALSTTLRPLARKQTCWQIFHQFLKTCVRPAVQPGYQRIEWTCYCGDQLYGDYDKRNPVALQDLASRLQRLACATITTKITHELPGVDCKVAVDDSQQDAGSSQGYIGDEPHATTAASGNGTQSIPLESVPSSSQPSVTTDVSSIVTQSTASSSSATTWSQSGMQRRFFELCVDTYGSEKATYLDEIDITKVKNDAELFHKIYESYHRLRGPRFRPLFLGPRFRRLFLRPTHVHFVRFGVQKRYRVGIYEFPFAIPPKSEVDAGRYHYHVCPLDTMAPMDHNNFFHYLKKHRTGALANPAHMCFEDDDFFLQRLPKKVGTSIFDHSHSSFSQGWGVHIVEGPHKEAMAWILCFLIIISLLVSILYAHYAKSQEQGFAIGQWFLSVMAIAMGAVYFHFTEQ